MRMAVDVANGAAYKSTPCILRELGADLTIAHNEPNGTNINAECGSTYPAGDSAHRERNRRAVGITHDGDADRVLLCDEKGEIVDGDEILAIAAIDLLKSGRLRAKDPRCDSDEQLRSRRSARSARRQSAAHKVGDRYVIEEMVRGEI